MLMKYIPEGWFDKSIVMSLSLQSPENTFCPGKFAFLTYQNKSHETKRNIRCSRPSKNFVLKFFDMFWYFVTIFVVILLLEKHG